MIKLGIIMYFYFYEIRNLTENANLKFKTVQLIQIKTIQQFENLKKYPLEFSFLDITFYSVQLMQLESNHKAITMYGFS